MARLAPVVTGDVNLIRARTFTTDELQGVEFDSSADVVAHIWRDNIDPTELECTVTGDDSVDVEFGDEYGWLAIEATAGPWLLEYLVTFADGDIITLPGGWPDQIQVRDDHNPVTP